MVRTLKEYLNSYMPLPLPRVYWIETTSVCNLRCVMCPQSKGITRRRPKMPMGTFRRIIDDVCECHPLIKLYLLGEPLLHDGLLDMIEYAGAKGCQTMIHTNATLLTKEMSKRILESSLTFLSFSFDGCTPETFERLRPPANFEKVRSNIEQYLDLRRRSGNPGPHSTVEIIRMKDTDRFIDDFVAQWTVAGADDVSVRDYMTWLDTVEDRRFESRWDYGYKPCSSPFRSGCILSDGKVVPCCLDITGEMPLGNIEDSSFREIWPGPAYEQLRARMITGDIVRGSICDGCTSTRCRSRKQRFTTVIPRFLSAVRSRGTLRGSVRSSRR